MPSKLNTQPPISAPMTPTMMLPTRPKLPPLMICPAIHPATAPITKKIIKPTSVMLPRLPVTGSNQPVLSAIVARNRGGVTIVDGEHAPFSCDRNCERSRAAGGPDRLPSAQRRSGGKDEPFAEAPTTIRVEHSVTVVVPA